MHSEGIDLRPNSQAFEFHGCSRAIKTWGLLGDPRVAAAENVAAEMVWDLWLETTDWCVVEEAVEGWIREGRRCVDWLQMILVMEQDKEDPAAASGLMGEASNLLGLVYCSLGSLSTRLWAIQHGGGKKYPQMLWPYSRYT